MGLQGAECFFGPQHSLRPLDLPTVATVNKNRIMVLPISQPVNSVAVCIFYIHHTIIDINGLKRSRATCPVIPQCKTWMSTRRPRQNSHERVAIAWRATRHSITCASAPRTSSIPDPSMTPRYRYLRYPKPSFVEAGGTRGTPWPWMAISASGVRAHYIVV